MSDFPGKLGSESEDQSSLAHFESTAQELAAKQSRFTYTRDFLFSLANLDAGKQLPSGIDQSILCELDSVCPGSSQSFRDPGYIDVWGRIPGASGKTLLQNSEYDGLLGKGASLGVCGRVPGASAPKFEDNSHPLLHKSREPFRPRHHFKAVNRSGRNVYNDDTLGSSECLNRKEEEKQTMRRDLFEVMTDGQKNVVQKKQKKNSIEHGEKSKFVTLVEDSADDKRNKCEKSEERVISPASVDNSTNSDFKQTPVSSQKLSPCLLSISLEKDIGTNSLSNSLIPEHSDLTADYTKSPVIFSSKFADQVPVTETTPTSGISCSEGSEYMAHEVSKELTREPSNCTGSEKRLQSTDDSFSLIQQSSVESSARNDVLELCKFLIPIEDDYVFPSTIDEYGLIGIDCEDSMSSSTAELSKSRENQLVSDDFVAKIRSGVEFDPGLKLNPISCFDEERSLPIELLLPDEDSLITADDFRIMPNKENDSMLVLEENPVKADGVSSGSPVDISRKLTGLNIFKDDACKSPPQFHQAQSKQGKSSFGTFDSQPAQAQLSSQKKPIASNYNPHKPSSPSRHTSSSNIPHAKPHQQMLIPGRIPPHQLSGSPTPRGPMNRLPRDQSRYLQELSPPQEFLSVYQYPSIEYFGIPNPGFHVYGLTDLTFVVNRNERNGNAGTGFYLGCPHSGNL